MGSVIARLLMRAAVRLWPPERHADECDCPLHRAYRLGDSRGYHRCSKEAARREYMLIKGVTLAELDRLETVATEARES